MHPRLNLFSAEPETMKAMMALSDAVAKSGLEPSLLELVKIRASQINGCANCLHMHARDARKHGESEERIYLLDAWREAPCYTERERAALAWTETLTLIAQTRAPDADYAILDAEFSKEDQVKLTLAINTINAWNRFAVGFRMIPDVALAKAAA
ncbi:carboxymuconolactone decarboxylase family protein [Aquabacter sp. CN5-332]|uniref:carboxymuconolactone decarboxylase family protein n=1 Tax=Aquabacter sp. CN5-332 TaxID=3156608 RepID=UPI0032B3815D